MELTYIEDFILNDVEEKELLVKFSSTTSLEPIDIEDILLENQYVYMNHTTLKTDILAKNTYVEHYYNSSEKKCIALKGSLLANEITIVKLKNKPKNKSILPNNS